jgi:lipoyl(octanoyl) transferase
LLRPSSPRNADEFYNQGSVIQYLYLDRVDYDEALRLQEEVAALRLAGRIPNTLLLLEHPPVLTLGRNADRSNVLAGDALLAARGVMLHHINRGGDVTYHGPGQLVGYPIFDLRSMRAPTKDPVQNQEKKRLGPVDFVRMMEEALIRLCGVYGVTAGRIPGLTGVWCGVPPKPQNSSESLPPRSGAKIAAIGIHVARGIVTHGFAFNVTTNLADFQLIHPCGITDKPVTSLERELAQTGAFAAAPPLEAIANQAARQFGLVFEQQILAIESLAALRAQAAGEILARHDDTPLTVPFAESRLHGDADPLVKV